MTSVTTDTANTSPWGIVAEFPTPAALYHAAGKVTEQGYRRVDTHTPFPIHGIDRQLQHGSSHLGWFCALGGVIGVLGAQWMQWWMNGVDYPIWVSGKRPYAWPSSIPITFELMVLVSALFAVIGMLVVNRLPRLYHPVFKHSTFHRVTDDRFFLSIEARDAKFDRTDTAQFLQGIGATNIEIVED